MSFSGRPMIALICVLQPGDVYQLNVLGGTMVVLNSTSVRD